MTPAERRTAAAAIVEAAILIDAGGWCRGWGAINGPRCLLHALYDATTADHEAYTLGRHLLSRAIDSEPWDIGDWNDAPGRTVGDIHGVLDRAIRLTWTQKVTALECEPSRPPL